MSKPVRDKFLGDGVYASYDGYNVWLAVGTHFNKAVALEPEVMKALFEYNKEVNDIDDEVVIDDSSKVRMSVTMYNCPNCNNMAIQRMSNYCPHCGKKVVFNLTEDEEFERRNS